MWPSKDGTESPSSIILEADWTELVHATTSSSTDELLFNLNDEPDEFDRVFDYSKEEADWVSGDAEYDFRKQRWWEETPHLAVEPIATLQERDLNTVPALLASASSFKLEPTELPLAALKREETSLESLLQDALSTQISSFEDCGFPLSDGTSLSFSTDTKEDKTTDSDPSTTFNGRTMPNDVQHVQTLRQATPELVSAPRGTTKKPKATIKASKEKEVKKKHKRKSEQRESTTKRRRIDTDPEEPYSFPPLDPWQATLVNFLTLPSEHIAAKTGERIPLRKVAIWGRQKVKWASKSTRKGRGQLSSKMGGNLVPHRMFEAAKNASSASTVMPAKSTILRMNKEQALWFNDESKAREFGTWIGNERLLCAKRAANPHPPPLFPHEGGNGPPHEESE